MAACRNKAFRFTASDDRGPPQSPATHLRASRSPRNGMVLIAGFSGSAGDKQTGPSLLLTVDGIDMALKAREGA